MMEIPGTFFGNFAGHPIIISICRFKEKKLSKKSGLSKFDQDCRNINGRIKHCLDIQVKRLRIKNSANEGSRVTVDKRK